MKTFQQKLSLWSKGISQGCTEMFSCLNDFLTNNEISLSTSVKNVILDHMAESILFVKKYFPNLNDDERNNWIRTPFAKSLIYNHITSTAQEELIDIRSGNLLEVEFNEKSISEVWLRRQQEYPAIGKEALVTLIPFATTYL
ncbi:zinc finger BED domain-containing protein 5-like [Arctopsyche grandis]|uniref:zinc finger BED domain-containing protein 5-like n=1 Tax=Arctopsyche grandis TaxID=121162 RepID=UPI00406D768F